MNREQLREYVKQLPQEEVLRELLISQVDCNTKLEEVRETTRKIEWHFRRLMYVIAISILLSTLLGAVTAIINL